MALDVADTRIILCLNAGSSSLKCSLYRINREHEKLLAVGRVERIGLEAGDLWCEDAGQQRLVAIKKCFPDQVQAAGAILDTLDQLNLAKPAAVGHRIVHGGSKYNAPRLVTPELIAYLRSITNLAPLHIPAGLHGIEASIQHFPGLPQVACFDTAFHHGMPEVAQRFPLPDDLWRDGVRRYGFHGLSYEYIVEKLGPEARGRVIIAHLGNGASLAALRDGKPVDTTMGFTPIGGIVMGTRCGDLDPGVLLHLVTERGLPASEVETMVNRRSGLLGISGLCSDMKTLLAERDRHAGAARAVAMFCYSLRKNIGALAATLGGLDTLVFTGGIGERAAAVRSETCDCLEHLGIVIDEESNRLHAETINSPAGPCSVKVIPTSEDLMIARHTSRVMLARPE